MGKVISIIFVILFSNVFFGQEIIFLSGKVIDVDSKEWQPNSHIIITKKNKVIVESYSNGDGEFSAYLKSNQRYNIEISKIGYRKLNQELIIGDLKMQKQNYIKIYLEKEGIKVKGRVFESEVGIPLANFKVILFNNNQKTKKTVRSDINGEYVFKVLKDVNYTIKLDTTLPGNVLSKQVFSTINMNVDDDILIDFKLKVELPDMNEFIEKARAARIRDSSIQVNIEQIKQKVITSESKEKERESNSSSDLISSFSIEPDAANEEVESTPKRVKEPKQKKKKESETTVETATTTPTDVTTPSVMPEMIIKKSASEYENMPVASAKIDTKIKKTLTIDDYNRQLASGALDGGASNNNTATLQAMDMTEKDKIYVENNTIYYPAGKALLNRTAIDFIVELVEKVKFEPTKKLLIEVFSDADQEYLIKDYICRLRSEEVVSYLINKGLPFDKMSISNIGNKILANNCSKGVQCTDEEHGKNRRVKFTIVDSSVIDSQEIIEDKE